MPKHVTYKSTSNSRKINVYKKAIRCLGIAESFKKENKYAVLVGVVMRSDFIIDGVYIERVTVGGMDSTEAVIRMYHNAGRNDINFLLINGVIISYYNIIDLNKLFNSVKIPIISITYRESKGLEEILKKLFPDWRERIEVYRRNGKRIPLPLKTGHIIYVRYLGVDFRECMHLVNKFTIEGKHPEPVRIAKIIARSINRYLCCNLRELNCEGARESVHINENITKRRNFLSGENKHYRAC